MLTVFEIRPVLLSDHHFGSHLGFPCKELSQKVKKCLNIFLNHTNMGIDTKIITICQLLTEIQLDLIIGPYYGGHIGFFSFPDFLELGTFFWWLRGPIWVENQWETFRCNLFEVDTLISVECLDYHSKSQLFWRPVEVRFCPFTRRAPRSVIQI